MRIDIETCPACGTAVRTIACIEDPVVIHTIRSHEDTRRNLTAWPEHPQPNDFWRFTTAGLAELFGPQAGFEVVATGGYAS